MRMEVGARRGDVRRLSIVCGLYTLYSCSARVFMNVFHLGYRDHSRLHKNTAAHHSGISCWGRALDVLLRACVSCKRYS